MDPHKNDIPLLAQITRMQFQMMHQFLATVGLYPGQFFVLQLLGGHPAGLSQKEIGNLLFIKPSSVNQIIVNLEKASYISRSADEKDKRVMRVVMTEEGKKVLSTGKEKFSLIQQTTKKNISEEDLATFDRIAAMMRDNLKELQ